MIAVSIIIPAFNRIAPLRQTLRSAAEALNVFAQSAEILLVDDGSTPPLQEQLAGFDAGHPITFLRQPNQGSIIARQTGLAAARGEWILFLDSDDLIPPEKFSNQLGSLAAAASLDVVYADMAHAITREDGVIVFTSAEKLARTTEPAELFLTIQPAPHNPLYRRDYLLRALSSPLIAPERRHDPAGDVWLYYNLCTHPARIGKVDAPLCAAGVHSEDRYSLQWEKLAAAALPLMESFAARCPRTDATLAARTILGERAFLTWRGLPRDFSSDFTRRMLAIWKNSPRGPIGRLGQSGFQKLSRILGPQLAASLLRMRNAPYSRARTLDDAQYDRLFNSGNSVARS
ncbi:MAG: glycosyltransferase family 2 protein [Nibricoccus sp.]